MFEFVRKNYGVPAQIGRRVICEGETGTIVKDCGHYIGVILDSLPGRIQLFHPTWRVTYGETVCGRDLPRLTRSQQHYADYLDADSCRTFAEFLGIAAPVLEHGHGRDQGLYRYSSTKAMGEFCATRQQAKASYKAALQAKRYPKHELIEERS